MEINVNKKEMVALMDKLLSGHDKAKKTMSEAAELHFVDGKLQRVLVSNVGEALNAWRLCRGVANTSNIPLWYWCTGRIKLPEMVDAAFQNTLNNRDKKMGDTVPLGVIFIDETEKINDHPEVLDKLLEAINGREIKCDSGRVVNTKDLMFVFGSVLEQSKLEEVLPDRLKSCFTERIEL